jgi:hypothetical protein
MNGVVSRLHANVGFGEAGETSRTTGLGAKQTAIDQSSTSAIHQNRTTQKSRLSDFPEGMTVMEA